MASHRRVLLVRPLCAGDEPEFAEPLGIERLAGYLRAHGIKDVRLFDRRLYEEEHRRGCGEGTFWADVRAAYGREGRDAPTHVGVSLMSSSDVPDALRLISRVRAYWPQAALGAGGVFVTTAPDEARRLLPDDVVLMRGEGEAHLLAWVRGEEMTDASEMLAPNDWAMAWRPDLLRYAALGCAVNVQTSRGCPGACSFCATGSLPAACRAWQPRDLSLVVAEVEKEVARLEAVGLPAVFNFVDDDFGPLTRVEALADELVRRALRVSFAVEMRMTALAREERLAERLGRLHEAGLTRVFVGIESLNPETLRVWRKPYEVSRVPDVVQAFVRAGVTLQPGYILWHAGQTVAGALAEVSELWRLGIYNHRAGLSRLIVFPGCDLACDAAELGEAQVFYDEFVERAPELTREWLAAAIAEPYAAAAAHLTGEETRLRELRATLDNVNRCSYRLFVEMANEYAARDRGDDHAL